MPTPDAGRFDGFADRDARFFRRLAKNQSRDWFAAHRHEYDAGWLRPMQALLDEVRDRLERVFPRLPLAPPKVFRIHRDVRFSADKSPYKTHIGGYVPIDGGGSGPSAVAPLYLHLGATDRFACAGHYMMDGSRLARFRAAILDDATGTRLATALTKLERAGFSISSHDTLKKVPRGLDPAHPRAALLKRKGLVVAFPTMPRDLLVSRRLVDWLVRHGERSAPVVEWLAALGE